MPDDWPVHARPELATLRVVEVARRSDEILFCDDDHHGPHIWPDGEYVDQILPQPGGHPNSDSDAEHAS